MTLSVQYQYLPTSLTVVNWEGEAESSPWFWQQEVLMNLQGAFPEPLSAYAEKRGESRRSSIGRRPLDASSPLLDFFRDTINCCVAATATHSPTTTAPCLSVMIPPIIKRIPSSNVKAARIVRTCGFMVCLRFFMNLLEIAADRFLYCCRGLTSLIFP